MKTSTTTTNKATPTPEHLPAEGDCYQIALNFILFEVHENTYTLVHGRPTLQCPPYCQYGHAWLETESGIVIDKTNGFIGPREIYYGFGQIEPEHSFYYSKDQARTLVLKYKHYGPWEGPDVVVKPKRKRRKK